jgi:hypothetical protein
MLTNATVREPAQLLDGAKEPQDPPKMPATTTMRQSPETNALALLQRPTTPTETTTVTETEPAQETGGAKEPPDDHHLIQIMNNQPSNHLFVFSKVNNNYYCELFYNSVHLQY